MNSKQYSIFHNHRLGTLGLSIVLFASVLATAVHADDVEIYRTQESNTLVKPNLLFVLDESSSMQSTDGDSTTRTQELQAALREIFADPDPDDQDGDGDLGGVTDVNAAMLGYSKRQYLGRRVISDFQDVDTNRATFQSLIDSIQNPGGTTTVQAMAAAVQWFESGFTDDDGLNSYDGWNGIGADGDANDTQVATPVTEELYCAQSNIILLTDGAPYSDQSSSNADRHDPHPFAAAGYEYKGTACTNPDPSGFSMSRAGCTGDIAEWAYSNDLFPTIQGDQNIVTYTIGFHTGSDEEAYLQDIASRGGGSYFPSSDTAGLVTAFNAIITEAQASVEYTFNAPVIPFNSTNAAVSGDRIYLPLLKPDVTAFWKGNIKKYAVSYDDLNSEVDIKDSGNLDVVDDNLTFQDTRDYWNSGSADDGDPLVGGAASKMNAGTVTRNLYSYLGTQTDLTHDDNRVRRSNSNITAAMLGAADSAERDTLLYWANWLEADGTTARQGEMGAPLHTTPMVVDYSAGNDLVLINTTEGILHAFDSTNGREVWAFMPDELLSTIKDAKENAESTTPMYGLDGPMTYYEIGTNKYVVVGMRRGGRNYYALNITNRTQPQFLWEIKGGVTTDFGNLGQTWSKPILTQMEIEGTSSQNVLVFGGGYDSDQDNATSRSNDDLGNSIFIVNPTTGARIREITSTDMVLGTMGNGIAGDILPVDINANGVTDRLYAADVGGRLIRVDIPDAALSQITGTNSLTGTLVADVGGADGFQRFFNTPEVAFYNRGGVTYLALMIASGHRPSPLDASVTDRFYMIKDPNVWTAPADTDDAGSDPDYPASITEADLYNATDNLIQDGNGNDSSDTGSKAYAQQQLNNAKGWYIDFASGEKGLSEAKVYDYAVLFTTYKGTRTGGPLPCVVTATSGESQLYIVNMNDGSAMFDIANGVLNKESTGTRDVNDRKLTLNIPGMPPSPTLMFPADGGGLGGKVIAIVGLESPAEWLDRFHPISWEEYTD